MPELGGRDSANIGPGASEPVQHRLPRFRLSIAACGLKGLGNGICALIVPQGIEVDGIGIADIDPGHGPVSSAVREGVVVKGADEALGLVEARGRRRHAERRVTGGAEVRQGRGRSRLRIGTQDVNALVDVGGPKHVLAGNDLPSRSAGLGTRHFEVGADGSHR